MSSSCSGGSEIAEKTDIVLDASACVAYMLRNERSEEGRYTWLRGFFEAAAPVRRVVPYLFPAEVLRGLQKARTRIAAAEPAKLDAYDRKVLAELYPRVMRGFEVVDEGLIRGDGITHGGRCTRSDMIYVKLAVDRQAPLLSWDNKQVACARDRGVAAWLPNEPDARAWLLERQVSL